MVTLELSDDDYVLFRTMSERELREKTNCTEVNTEQGNLINSITTWNQG